MALETLSEEEVDSRLEELEIWGMRDNDVLGQRLMTRVEFDEYRDCVRFANELFELAEEGKVPAVKVFEDAVAVDVMTDDVDGFTEEDFDLAENIEEKLKEGDWS